MTILDGPMNIRLNGNDIRLLCEAAIDSEGLTDEQITLIRNICHHMIWDDLSEKFDAKVGVSL